MSFPSLKTICIDNCFDIEEFDSDWLSPSLGNEIEKIKDIYEALEQNLHPFIECIDRGHGYLEAAKFFHYLAAKEGDDYKEYKNRFNLSPFQLAVKNDALGFAEIFINDDRSSVINKRVFNIDETVLMNAIKNNNSEMVELILKRDDIDFSLTYVFLNFWNLP